MIQAGRVNRQELILPPAEHGLTRKYQKTPLLSMESAPLVRASQGGIRTILAVGRAPRHGLVQRLRFYLHRWRAGLRPMELVRLPRGHLVAHHDSHSFVCLLDLI